MSEKLPQGWEVAELGALGRWRGGGTPSKSVPAYWSNGTVHWVSPKDMKRLMIDSAEDQITLAAVKESAANLIPKDSVLMVTRSGILEHTFPVAINTVEVAVNQDLKAWTPHPGINPLYAAYFLKAEGRTILDNCAKDGTTVASIDFDRLKAYPVRLAPEPEQARIVSKIDELFSSIDEGERALERVRKLVERYRQSVLKAAVTGELTREWREQQAGEPESGEALLARILEARRKAWETAELAKITGKKQRPTNEAWRRKYKEPAAPDSFSLAKLPSGWIWASVEQLSTTVVDGVHKKPNYVPNGIPFVTVRNLTAGPGISFEKLNYITAEDHEEFTKRTKPERGDVLVSKDGTLGTIRFVNTEVTFSIFVSVALVKPVERNMGRFMEVALSSPPVQAQMVPKGTGLQHIHLEDLRKDCLPLCSLAEQSAIVDLVALRLSQIDQIDQYLQGQLVRARTLRQAVLKAAFSGRLVPQSSSDEPALLVRVAAEHEGRSSSPQQSVKKQVRKRKAKA